MNHFTDFDPILIREHNQQIREEVDSLRLGKRLRKGRNPRGPRPVASPDRGGVMLSGARLAGWLTGRG
jgi:hypothetical protein